MSGLPGTTINFRNRRALSGANDHQARRRHASGRQRRGLTVTSSPKHAAIRRRIEEIGIIPSVHAASAQDAEFATRTVFLAGIPIVEISMTVPGALPVISDFARHAPALI